MNARGPCNVPSMKTSRPLLRSQRGTWWFLAYSRALQDPCLVLDLTEIQTVSCLRASVDVAAYTVMRQLGARQPLCYIGAPCRACTLLQKQL